MFVIWRPEAEDGLADVYTRLYLFEQRALVATVERIDRQLAEYPAGLGEEREPDVRI